MAKREAHTTNKENELHNTNATAMTDMPSNENIRR